MKRDLIISRIHFTFIGICSCILMTYLPVLLGYSFGEKSNQYIPMVFSGSALAIFFGHLFFGHLYDKSRNTNSFIWISLFSQVVLLIILYLYHENFYLTFSAVLICSFFSSAIFPAVQSHFTVIYPDKKSEVLSDLFSYESWGWAIFCTLSLILFWDIEDPQIKVKIVEKIILYGILSGLLCMVIQNFFPKHFVKLEEMKENRETLKEKLLLFAENPVLKWFVGFIFLMTLANVSMFSLFTRYYLGYVGGNESTLSLVLLLATFLGAISYPFFGRAVTCYGEHKVILSGLLLYGTTYFLLLITHSVWMTGIIYSLPLYPVVRVVSNGFIARNTDEQRRGTGIGMIEGVHTLAVIVGPFLGWIVVECFSLKMLPGLSLLLTVIALIPLKLSWNKEKGKISDNPQSDLEKEILKNPAC